ncbi:MAG: hypothetical protein JNN27_12170 [Planctomycetes bacterium]|nr:hypothetical protein [Planctomycetota bacterium]
MRNEREQRESTWASFRALLLLAGASAASGCALERHAEAGGRGATHTHDSSEWLRADWEAITCSLERGSLKSLHFVGDVDADGCADLVAGLEQPYVALDLNVHSATTGWWLERIEGPDQLQRSVGFPRACVPIGDVDGNGADDLVVLTGRWDFVNQWPPFAIAYGSRSGLRLHETPMLESGNRPGEPGLAPAPDLDGDGVRDYLVWRAVAPEAERGQMDRLLAFSARTGVRIAPWGADPPTFDVLALALDGDGFDGELKVLERRRSPGRVEYLSSAYGFRSGDPRSTRPIAKRAAEHIVAAHSRPGVAGRPSEFALATSELDAHGKQELQVVLFGADARADRAWTVALPEELGCARELRSTALANAEDEAAWGVAVAVSWPRHGRVAVFDRASAAPRWLPETFEIEEYSALLVAAAPFAPGLRAARLVVGEPRESTQEGRLCSWALARFDVGLEGPTSFAGARVH